MCACEEGYEGDSCNIIGEDSLLLSKLNLLIVSSSFTL